MTCVGFHVRTPPPPPRLHQCIYIIFMRASELTHILDFHNLKLPFLSIFCRYFKYFVGTNDTLVGLHVPTKLIMEQVLIPLPPPPRLRQSIYMRASLDFFFEFPQSKTAIPFYILSVQMTCS